MRTTANSLLANALIGMGADGLCCPSEQCGCGLDDLAPGDCLNVEECVAAKWIKPKKDDPDYNEEYEDGYFKAVEA